MSHAERVTVVVSGSVVVTVVAAAGTVVCRVVAVQQLVSYWVEVVNVAEAAPTKATMAAREKCMLGICEQRFSETKKEGSRRHTDWWRGKTRVRRAVG
jgi:hypothetical protein